MAPHFTNVRKTNHLTQLASGERFYKQLSTVADLVIRFCETKAPTNVGLKGAFGNLSRS